MRRRTHSTREFRPFPRGPLPAEPFFVRFLAVLAATLLAASPAIVLAADALPTGESPPVGDSPPSSDRLTAALGTPAVGGMRIDDRSSSSAALVSGLQYDHRFAPWLDLGVGFQMQHQLDASVAAYRPYASVRAVLAVPSAELGFAFRAGPTWFRYAEQTFGSVAPSIVFDGRVDVSERFSLVGGIELLASGVHVDASNTQLWNVAAIASLGVSVRL
jgi:hypothetical protein